MGFDTSEEIRSIEVKEEAVAAVSELSFYSEDTNDQENETDETPERIVHTLDFDLDEEPDFVQEVQEAPIDDASQEVDFSLFEQHDQVESDFEALRNVEVEYDTVYGHQEHDLDHNANEDFTIIDTTELLRNIEVIAEEVLSTKADDYGDFAFELPLVVNNEDSDSEEQPRTVVFDLNEPIEEPEAAVSEASDETPASPKIKTISAYELDFDDDFEQVMTLKTKEV